ncbi:MAG: sulfotransferase domain-containing protein, partial [Rubrobacteraceae bacterium]
RERVRIRSERRAAREQKRAERRKKKENKVQREMVGQEVDYLSNERRDPPRERIETAHLRQLPDFIIIGTQRGGTTSLYRYLTEHPDVGAAFRKEVHFFDRYYEKGMDWYLAHFPVRGEFPVVGEASPYYLLHPEAPERARKAVPHARFIVLLRNPVDRAYSQYHMKVKRGVEPLPFEDAIDKERERLGSTDDPVSLAWRHYSYVERSLYVDQLRRWMNVFPREQFLILKSEDLYEDPQRILHQTQEYLGLRPWSLPGYEAYNLKEYADIDPATRRRLVDYFAPHNQQLYALLGRDLGWEHER